MARSPESQQFSANTYAERLMDDLFQDVERLLDLDPSVTPESTPLAEPESPDLPQPFPSTEVREDLAPAMPLAPRPGAIALQQFPANHEHSLAEVMPENPVVPITPVTPTPVTPKSWERFLLALGCVSVVVSLGLWLLYQDGKQRQQAAVVASAGVATDSLADQQFANYLQKSLQQIDQQGQQPAENAQPSGNGVNIPGMPSVVIPKTNSPSPMAVNPANAGLERIYVPVYQLPTNLYPPGAAVTPLPNLPKTQKSTAKVNVPATSTSASSGVLRRLVGVLEQGNSSVALFEINGITQRYELGESIGSSGWTLVEVSKNQAIIRRNGDVRSLIVGHSF